MDKKYLKVLLIIFCFYINWLWVDFASELDFNLYNYLELWIFALVQYFFASIGLYALIVWFISIIKQKDTK